MKDFEFLGLRSITYTIDIDKLACSVPDEHTTTMVVRITKSSQGPVLT